ncbi:phage tail tape measure protein [Domibacillus indicus]|uniref:phage tail tape measure protein n=1 Tax=Domibacillus indicus TaxID=1437523 RepID=UPI00203F4726|nr:phage tail tape measure protein [Domibacillus indicus]MCM3789421.1 phage tail tape measure protein [Domibacillus indicus]
MAKIFNMGARLSLVSSGYTSGIRDSVSATNGFAQQISIADAALGRFYDRQGRLREANGRYATATHKSVAATVAFRVATAAAVVAVGALAAGIGAVTSAAAAMAGQIDQSTGKIQAMTGATKEEAAQMTAAAAQVYANGWGPALDQVATDMAGLKQVMGDVTESTMEGLYIIEQVSNMQAPVDETAKVVKTLTANFAGLSQTDALDIITTGFQRGGNYAGDMLDTLNEYSMQFADLGLSADQMMSMLIEGSKQGAFMLDKVGDSVKESFIRLQDGSKTSREGFAAIGLDATKMAQDIAAGGQSAQAAYEATLMGLAALEDPLARETAGVQLFGTQWEDMGDSVILAMQKGMKGLGDFQGATAAAGEALQNTLGAKWEQFSRQFVLGFAQLGQPVIDGLKKILDWALANLPGFFAVVQPIVMAVGTFLVGAFKALTPVIAAISPYLVGIGVALATVGAYFAAVALKTKVVLFAMRLLFAVLTMNPITMIAVGVGLLIGYLIRMAGGWQAAGQRIAEFWAKLQPFIAQIASVVIPALKQIGSAIVTAFSTLRDFVTPILNQIIGMIVAGFGGLVAFIQEHWTLISTIIYVAWTYIWTQTKVSVTAIWTVVQVAFQIISTVIQAALSFVSSVVSNAWTFITSVFKAGLQLLQGDWRGAWDTMMKMLDTVKSNIKGFFSNLKDLFFESGKKIVSTLADGITSMASAPIDAISGVLSKVREFLPFSDAKRGPLSQLTYNGGKIVSTMAEGIYKQRGALTSAMNDVLADAPGASVGIEPGTASPAGSTAAIARAASKSITIQNLIGGLTIDGSKTEDPRKLAMEIINIIYELLAEASDTEATGLGDLI